MRTYFKQTALVALAFTLILSLGSCEATKNANNKQKGAVIGAASGAVLGAILGNNIGKGGNGELGAVIGGVVGGGAGVLIGSKMDKQAQKIEQEIPGAQVERVDDGIVITFDEVHTNYMFDLDKVNAQKFLLLIEDYKKSDASYVGRVSDFIKIKDDKLILRMYKNNYGSQNTIVLSRPNILKVLDMIKTQIIESQVHYSKFNYQGELIVRQDFITLPKGTQYEMIVIGLNEYYKNVVHDLVTTDQIGAYQAGNNIIVYANHPHNETVRILFVTTYSKSFMSIFKMCLERANLNESIISLPDYEYCYYKNKKHFVFKINGSHKFTKEYIGLSDLINLNIYSNAEPSYCEDGTYVRITNPNNVNALRKCILTFNFQ